MKFRTMRIEVKVPASPYYRKVPYRRAKKEIREYIQRKRNPAWIEDIVDDLRIDTVTVLRAVKQLEKEKKIHEAKMNDRKKSRRSSRGRQGNSRGRPHRSF